MLDWLGSLPVTDIALALICGGVARPCQRAVYALVALLSLGGCGSDDAPPPVPEPSAVVKPQPGPPVVCAAKRCG